MFPGKNQDDETVRTEKSWVKRSRSTFCWSGCPPPGKKGHLSFGKGWTQLLLPLVRGWLSDSIPDTPHQRVPETCRTLYSHVGNHSEEYFCKNNSFALAKKTELEYDLPGTVLGTKLMRCCTCGWKIKIVLLLVFWNILYSSLVFLPFSVLGFLTSQKEKLLLITMRVPGSVG